ncbi:hypothetical protein HIM_06253 [Hirsutella minnesotensis 3608]|uniref:HTH CENPB-type domain-containing protein n=1 Tax=Hirsutella minnesotensis 3608 TaxID=1043627 RepID=A0A0F7ZZH8_9HYPO|nr:hypothetical protein HIM_06253 [Hirsutella minnesotensis 3608]
MESRTREAVQYIRDVPGAKIASVAREFGIPRNRLRSRLQGHHPKAGRPAANLKLSRPEEAALCRYIDRLDNMNLAVRPGFVTDATNNILRERSGPSGQADFIIGSKWTSRFLKRHGYFKKLQKKLHAERQASEDLTRVTNYFQTLEKVVQEHGIPPDDIWNMDETGFRIGVGKDQLIVTKGKRAHYFGIPENRDRGAWNEVTASPFWREVGRGSHERVG